MKFATGEKCSQEGNYKIRCYKGEVFVKEGENFPPHPASGKDANYTLVDDSKKK